MIRTLNRPRAGVKSQRRCRPVFVHQYFGEGQNKLRSLPHRHH